MPDDVLTPEPDALAPPSADVPEPPPPHAHAAPADVEHADEAPADEAAADDEPAAVEPPPPPPSPDQPLREEGDEAVAAGAEDAPAEGEEAPPPEPSKKRWYVVKVQSGREETIKEAIERRVKIERLEEFFGRIIIPVEKVTEMRKSKRVVKERKLYPGYLMAEVEYNDRILYLFRETSGVGDFVGGSAARRPGDPPSPPPPMSDREVEKILDTKPGESKEIKAKPRFGVGDRVKVRDGTFAGMEGEVKEILETLGHVRVELTIFGRPVPVELEFWQVENA